MKRWLQAGATIIAGLFVLYTLLSGRMEAELERGDALEQRGYYLKDATLTELGANGRARVVIRAELIEQRLADQSIDLQGLHMDYTPQVARTWTVTARRGHMPFDHESVTLSGDVVLQGGDEGSPAIVRTESLDYDMKANRVDSRAPVVLQFGAHRLAATGLKADLNAGNLQLESGVNGLFKP